MKPEQTSGESVCVGVFFFFRGNNNRDTFIIGTNSTGTMCRRFPALRVVCAGDTAVLVVVFTQSRPFHSRALSVSLVSNVRWQATMMFAQHES